MGPGGLDVGLDCSTFREPKSMLHKVQKTFMLETGVPETVLTLCILSISQKNGQLLMLVSPTDSILVHS